MCLITIGGSTIKNTFDHVTPSDLKYFQKETIDLVVAKTISVAEHLNRVCPTFTMDASISLLYPKLTVNFNDRRQNKVTFKLNNLYHNSSQGDNAVNSLLAVLDLIGSDEFITLVNRCLSDYYLENGEVCHTAITPIKQAVEVVVVRQARGV